MKRSNFIKLSSLGLASLSFKTEAPAAPEAIVIATWDSGKPVSEAAFEILKNGGRALDAVEAGAIHIENKIDCCVGLAGYPDRDGIVTLDACIMDEKMNCGAVAALERIKNPISVARKIMETTPHIMLAGDGAQQFAVQNGFKLEKQELSIDAKKVYEEWLKKSEYKPQINIETGNKTGGPFAPYYFEDGTANHDTMALVAMDKRGDFSGAVTTSGMAFKLHGRVGDSPAIGAGLCVDNEVGAACATGVGEEVIRTSGSRMVIEFMRQGLSPEMACKKAVERIVRINPAKAKQFQVAFIAIDKKNRHGGYSIQKGFMYAVRSDKEAKLIYPKSHFA